MRVFKSISIWKLNILEFYFLLQNIVELRLVKVRLLVTIEPRVKVYYLGLSILHFLQRLLWSFFCGLFFTRISRLGLAEDLSWFCYAWFRCPINTTLSGLVHLVWTLFIFKLTSQRILVFSRYGRILLGSVLTHLSSLSATSLKPISNNFY